jgi:hypothetical protein
MFNLDHALNAVDGELITVLDERAGDQFCYPSAIVVVKRNHQLHPFVAWRAIDSTRDNIPAHFECGNYCETLQEALSDSRKA